MRHALILLWLSTLVPAALAADWVRVEIPRTTDEYFFDRSKLVVNGNDVTYWKKVQFKPPRAVKKFLAVSTLMRERIDCREHTLRLLSFVYHDAQGAVIDYVADAEKEGAPIIPDTVGDKFEQVLCALARESAGNFPPIEPRMESDAPHPL
jgi:hypothetical protein